MWHQHGSLTTIATATPHCYLLLLLLFFVQITARHLRVQMCKVAKSYILKTQPTIGIYVQPPSSSSSPQAIPKKSQLYNPKTQRSWFEQNSYPIIFASFLSGFTLHHEQVDTSHSRFSWAKTSGLCWKWNWIVEVNKSKKTLNFFLKQNNTMSLKTWVVVCNAKWKNNFVFNWLHIER